MAGVRRDVSEARPGARYGLPAAGPGRLASWGARVVALVTDWVLCLLVSGAFASRDAVLAGEARLLPVLVLVVESAVLVATLGGSAGQLVLGVRVRRVDGTRSVGLGRSVLRAVLVGLVVPALIADRDRRGLHDRAAGTVVVRVR